MSQKPKFANKLPVYVNKCVEICWLMNTQSPPLVLAEPLHAGQKIDTFQYKEFTKHGDTVSFVVWLPLLIEKDGAVLTKGVVQPEPKIVINVPKSKPNAASMRDKVNTKKHDSSDEKSFATHTHEREKYDSGLTGHRQYFDEYVSRRPADFFQDSHYHNRTSNITSSGMSPSSISHPYSQNITTSTYRVRTTGGSDRPSSAYTEQYKDRSDYLNQRSVKTGSTHTAGDRGSYY